jgi:hypothetical protein
MVRRTVGRAWIFAVVLAAPLAHVGAARAAIVANPNFDPAGPAFPPYEGPIAGWTQTPAAPPYQTGSSPYVDAGGVYWDNGSAATGVSGNVGFIHVFTGAAMASLSQTLSLTVGSSYTLAFMDNARFASSDNPLVSASLGGVTLIASHMVTPVTTFDDASVPFDIETATFTATAASETLTLTAALAQGGSDATALFANVTVTPSQTPPPPPVPEPATVLLLGTALGGFLTRRFRRT